MAMSTTTITTITTTTKQQRKGDASLFARTCSLLRIINESGLNGTRILTLKNQRNSTLIKSGETRVSSFFRLSLFPVHCLPAWLGGRRNANEMKILAYLIV